MPARTIQFIYFDEMDESADGCGWNMIDNGSIASRYRTVTDAIATADAAGLPYLVLSRDVTPAEAAAVLADILAV